MYSDDANLSGGPEAAENEPQDLIEGVDEEGNKILLQVVRYFFYNGEEYVVLGDAQDMDDCGCDCAECHEHDEACADECDCGCDDDDDEPMNLYIMKVVDTEEDGEEMEEFVPVEDDDLLEKLIEVVQTDFESDEELEDE